MAIQWPERVDGNTSDLKESIAIHYTSDLKELMAIQVTLESRWQYKLPERVDGKLAIQVT